MPDLPIVERVAREDIAQIWSEASAIAERETVQRIVDAVKAEATAWGLAVPSSAQRWVDCAAWIDRKFGGEDKGGEPR